MRHAITFLFALLCSVLLGVTLACTDRRAPDLVPEDVGERYAEFICPAVMDCGCGLFESVEDCTRQMNEEFERIRPSLRGFDEECFDSHLSIDAYDLCVNWEDSFDLVPDCVPFYGDKQEGESCSESYWFRVLTPQGDCSEGLKCDLSRRICTSGGAEQPEIKEIGDPCREDAVSPCYNLDLSSDLYCHDGECREVVPLGEPCTHPRACGGWNRCIGWGDDGEGTCLPWLEPGEACFPEDVRTCSGDAEHYGWCNPATETCEVPVPSACALVLPG